MKKRIIIGTVGIGVLLAIIFGIYLVKNLTEKSNLQKEDANLSIKVVNVDEVVDAPDRYKGFLGVEGTVIKIDESKSIFLLGCEDACIFMPVKYTGQMPEPNSEIIVYGEVEKQEERRYIFEGKEVKTK